MSATLKPARLTASEATGFVAEVERNASGKAVIDLSALEAFDSAGLAALVNLASRATLLHAPEKLRRLAALYGMNRIFSEPA